jgi:hypothetical protein
MDSSGKLVRLVDHTVKHPANLIILALQFIVIAIVEIAKVLGEIEPDFSLADLPRS